MMYNIFAEIWLSTLLSYIVVKSIVFCHLVQVPKPHFSDIKFVGIGQSDGPTDRRTEEPANEHTILQRCKNPSKRTFNDRCASCIHINGMAESGCTIPKTCAGCFLRGKLGRVDFSFFFLRGEGGGRKVIDS